MSLVNIRMKWLPTFLFLLLVALPTRAFAQDAPAPGAAAPGAAEAEVEEEWKLERKEILKEIELEVKKQLDILVTKEKIVKEQLVKWRLEPPWAWPIQKSPKTIAQVEADLMKVLEAEAAKKFPIKQHQKRVAEEVEQKFKMSGVGDQVAFTVRGGRGTNTNIDGTVQAITAERIRIRQRWVHRDDIPEEYQAMFYEEVNAKMRKEYVEREQRIYDAKVENFKFEQRQDRLPGELLKAFYVPDRRQKNASLRNPNPEAWISREETVNLLYAVMRKAVGDKLRKEITEAKFKEAEYEYVTELKEWMPIDVAEDWRAAQAAKAAAAQPGEGGMEGGPPPEGMEGPPPM
ncbi:MAG: hypothetical protein GX574_09710 [Lentisphaerae bacterium]|mgnify:CR=1 FL=1|nr:hypothetical protein [Lentisphaerota bacterium]OQC15030.1 MAG: hypothetical protein BWX73_01552 [Lentisphaerae bacterium ADurb.Bin082]HQL86706.1 hypothetical protein [Lentisphaeria bacterium]